MLPTLQIPFLQTTTRAEVGFGQAFRDLSKYKNYPESSGEIMCKTPVS